MTEPTWIKTRDGSPTLWSNDLGESYRSVKGAFTESFKVFVEPALKDLQKKPKDSIVVGEFGLGPGTNWLLTHIFLRPLVNKLSYYAIERDPSVFQQGLTKWRECQDFILDFVSREGAQYTREQLEALLARPPQPLLLPQIDHAFQSGLRADYWFHDPFGYDVNPEGYSEETLTKCRVFLKTGGLGCSYACNKNFQLALEKTGFKFEILPTGDNALKRERLEFKVSGL